MGCNFWSGEAKLTPFHHTEFCSLSFSLLLSMWSYHFCYWVSQVIIVLPVKLTNCGGILPSNLLLVLMVPELPSPLWVKCAALLWFPRSLEGNKPIRSILATWKQLIDSWCVCHLPFFPDVSLSSTPPPTSLSHSLRFFPKLMASLFERMTYGWGRSSAHILPLSHCSRLLNIHLLTLRTGYRT